MWRLINQALKLVSRQAEVAFSTLYNLLAAAEEEKKILCSLTCPKRNSTVRESLTQRGALAAEVQQAVRPELNSLKV
jgi:hypothetical protein